ncbi:SCO family protein [Sulfobacillus thermosulfidooxidans]|uniref:SCO family protein n=1 Tax=Sulfobacillus thermosulfidooxidans TaxID=28034 RepID=UPI00096B9474|nr:SCO family protein [Sulfobacillus thermosulfidooxidans]OLZ11794.1 hypothetical protein BFX05_07350 [Sulfobacillus thermosulfidooxidans]OLZ17068.1 hypothetical protein BFX06_14125 [Sulfobacillus thermosulfidooxidans]OLZ20164.1 hypothetical protein BFX07_00855 [Sulfobacillus thermosulfidooxidans]
MPTPNDGAMGHSQANKKLPQWIAIAGSLLALSAGLWWGMRRTTSRPVKPANVQLTALKPSEKAKQAANAGILTPLQGKTAPNFALPDQNGHLIRLSQFRGKVVVLTPMDPTCTTVCPVLAGEIVAANHDLGPIANNVVFVGFNVDPYWESIQSLQKFDQEHGLTTMKNWYFVTGTTSQLEAVWRKYYIWVQRLPKQKSVNHASYIYFIGPHGHERWLVGGSADKSLSTSYTALIVQYAKALAQH